MASYTIFGDASPTTLVSTPVTHPLAFSTAFYVLGVTGWEVQGIRIYVPAGATVPTSPMKAYLWGSATAASHSPDVQLATVDFPSWTAGAWNTVNFTSSVVIQSGFKYWAQVWMSNGTIGEEQYKFSTPVPFASVHGVPLYAAAGTEVTTGQGSYSDGTYGIAPSGNFLAAWYGVDVVVISNQDTLPLRDNIVVTRSGLPVSVGASATATDTMGATTSDTGAFAVGGPGQIHTIRRSWNQVRILWGGITNTLVPGPQLISWADTPQVTVGMRFYVQWACRFIGGKFYKHPSLTGSVPVRLWSDTGVELGIVTLSLTADEGGWTEFTFPLAIELTPNVQYILSYYSPTGHIAFTNYIFYWWPDCHPPFVVDNYKAIGGVTSDGSVHHNGTAQVVPDIHTPANYYIDPLVEWDADHPVWTPGSGYLEQWVNGVPSYPFMIGIFWSDPENIQSYADMGINTNFCPADQRYVDAIKLSGMDTYPFAGGGLDPAKLVNRAIAEDPAYAARVKGYYVIDEPDQYIPYSPPSTIRNWIKSLRRVDSTRPVVIGMGRVVGINGTFYHQPAGSNMIQANQLWRDWAMLADIMDGDFYTLADSGSDYGGSSNGMFGIWMYGVFTERLRSLTEGRLPVWPNVETTSGIPNRPVPHEVRKAVWACLIAGANGITYFDHRWASAVVTQDFAAMLHTPAMKTEITALNARMMSLAPALTSPEAGLVTAWTSSNKTSGPLGGTYGVPMHFTTRDDGTNQYLFAMGIRPGATTATFTIPAWAGETVTVLDESRTVTVDGSGVLTDSFPADYTVHLYQL